MANSRSNIYPVQLQGAELNLNKYDAEIKQYSGFNKNNSPFVGGCLSNVFTKEDSVEGATDDNTIITENGDKYTVDTEGLYRNGEKLVSYPPGTTFFEERKLDMPVSVLKVLSDDIYIFKGDYGGRLAYILRSYEYVGTYHNQRVIRDTLLSYVVDTMTDEEFVFDRFHSMFINVIRGGSAAEFLIFTYWDNTSEGNEKYKYASIVVESGYLIIGVSGAPDISTDNSHASVKLWHKN
jgi:hypothetical protein